MKPNPAPHESNSDAALDDLLHAHLAPASEQLTPSSGFALSVMDAIHQQAAVPPPIAFPWRRVLPGAIAILCALAAFVLFVPAHTANPSAHLQLPAAFTSAEVILSAILLAVGLSVVTVAASFRLAGRTR